MTTALADPTKIQSATSPRRRINWQKQGVAYLFLLPALIVFTLVTWYPIVNTILYSFQKVNVAGVQGWVGFSNYVRMFGNPIFYKAWENTIVYVLLSLVMGAMVPIALALIINEKIGRAHV